MVNRAHIIAIGTIGTKCYNTLREYSHQWTFVKIMSNSLPNILNTQEPPMLGRWKRGNESIKVKYTNMDHCGDHICGSPKVLREMYPHQRK